MSGQSVIESLGFDRSINVGDRHHDLSESELAVIEQVSDFGIDLVYFNKDSNGTSFPAAFLKRVDEFDFGTLIDIANVHQSAWNYKKVLFLYVYSDTEVRIYNCSEKPDVRRKDSSNLESELADRELKRCSFSDSDQLRELNQLFSRVALDTGAIWSLEAAHSIRRKIDQNQRVDRYLVTSLVNTANQLQAEGLNKNFIHKILLRSLFLLYLEDRKAADVKFYSKIKKGATSYFDILDDLKATYDLFAKLVHHFKGNIFTVDPDESISVEQLRLIKKCFTSGNDNTEQSLLFEGWRIFDFSIIQIELLSEIYENFLVATEPGLKETSGTYYTPPALVEFILNEKLPIENSETEYKIRILDPACGSGIFLVESFRRLVKRYENSHKSKLKDFGILKKLLTDSIFGIELHPQAIKVAAFSLYLALVDHLDPKTIWQHGHRRLPNLINDPDDPSLKDDQGSNLFRRDTFSEHPTLKSIKFDLVVGNPPFGTKQLLQSEKQYCDEHKFAKEKVLPFLHKAASFAENGKIALICNTKILTNVGGTYQNFRRWLFNECYVEKVFNFSILRKSKGDFGGQLFGDAIGPISILFYQKTVPESASDRIPYYAPKTYVKSNVLDGLCIDDSDVTFLPRRECKRPDSKIWKIAMWGGMRDWELVSKIEQNYTTLKKELDPKNGPWRPFTGLNADSKKLEFTPKSLIDTRKVRRYYTSNSAAEPNSRKFRKIDESQFTPPFVLIKQAQSERDITASFVDFKSYSKSSTYIINGNVGDDVKKALVGFINSTFSKYYLFLVASSWGIERERASFEEFKSLPFLLDDITHVGELAKLVDKIIHKEKHEFFNVDISQEEQKIDDVIFKTILNLSDKEITTIRDTLDYGLDLYEYQERSASMSPVNNKHVFNYSENLCDYLNEFLQDEPLFANATIFDIGRHTPLMMVKISFEAKKRKILQSKEFVDQELVTMDKHLWAQKSQNIFFRKKINYENGNDILLARPNQRRFWSESMAIEDANDLIIDILTGSFQSNA